MTEPTAEESKRRIQQLDADTIQRIAAGEVVERPGSVVKELVENSLDAGASRITVDVQAGGTEAIRVSDDGHGIPREQLPRALDEHATSKIQDIADLDGGVASLGFRGEALSTIAAVSELTIRSRPQGENTGAELTVSGGDRGEIKPAGCPEGTTVEVETLFFNTPARKKFLKQDSTEFDHINTVVSQYALANPDVAISLSHNDRQLFGTEGSGSLRSTVLSVYGREVAESMIDIEYAVPDDVPVEAVSGLVSHPETTRSTREYLATFVNGRYVTDADLRGAVVDGYGGQLAPDRYPFAVVFLDVPPESVDVNVHPRKTEVRFDTDEAVLGALSEAVERTLIEDGLIRSSAPRGRSAPAETAVAPDAPDSETDEPQSTNVTTGTPDTETPDTEPTPNETESSRPASGALESDQPADRTVAEPLDPAAEDSWTVDGLSGTSADTAASNTAAENTSETAEAGQSTGTVETESSTPDEPATSESPTSTADSQPAGEPAGKPADESDDESTTIEMGDAKPIPTELTENGRLATEPTTQQTLSGGETTDRRRYDRLPPLRVLGQLHETYLLAATDDGLVLVDQHAADERVNYERLQNAIGDSPASQRLAEAVELELTAREVALFDDHSDALAEVGFTAERREDRTVEVRAVPTVFSTTLDPELLRDVLLSFVESTDESETIAEAVDELLADLACYPSITGNTSLTEGSVVDLLSALDDCDNPYACPHGRPVVIEISREEIENRFERDYPGHSGRRAE